jgi:hypothetical protein
MKVSPFAGILYSLLLILKFNSSPIQLLTTKPDLPLGNGYWSVAAGDKLLLADDDAAEEDADEADDDDDADETEAADEDDDEDADDVAEEPVLVVVQPKMATTALVELSIET